MKEKFKKIWQGWKHFAHIFGNIQARIILTILYFILVTPVAIVMVFFDPLKIKKAKGTWLKREEEEKDKDILEWARSQF